MEDEKKKAISISINKVYVLHKYCLAKTMKPSLTALNAISSQDKNFIIFLNCMPSNTYWHCKFREFALKRMRFYKILYNTDKISIFLHFKRLIKISGRKNWMLLRA